MPRLLFSYIDATYPLTDQSPTPDSLRQDLDAIPPHVWSIKPDKQMCKVNLPVSSLSDVALTSTPPPWVREGRDGGASHQHTSRAPDATAATPPSPDEVKAEFRAFAEGAPTIVLELTQDSVKLERLASSAGVPSSSLLSAAQWAVQQPDFTRHLEEVRQRETRLRELAPRVQSGAGTLAELGRQAPQATSGVKRPAATSYTSSAENKRKRY